MCKEDVDNKDDVSIPTTRMMNISLLPAEYEDSLRKTTSKFSSLSSGEILKIYANRLTYSSSIQGYLYFTILLLCGLLLVWTLENYPDQ